MSNDLTEYTKALLTCKFPQFNLLTTDDFIRYLCYREIRVDRKELECFEKMGIMLPVMRLHRPKTNDRHMKYAGMSTDAYSLQRAFADGIVSLPTVDTFKPWKEYKDGYEETAFTFYHPYQIVPLHYLLGWMQLRLSANSILNEKEPVKAYKTMKDYMEKSISGIQKEMPMWNKRVGSLMLLQEAYRTQVDGKFQSNFMEIDGHEKWFKWRKYEFSPQNILKKAIMGKDEVRNLYEHIVVHAQIADPISTWYVFTRLISRNKKRDLKDRALLAQDYYDMACILAYFLKDLGEEVTEPDDFMDGMRGSWKTSRYGDPFDYSKPEVRKAILDDYLQEPSSRLIILCEGETEETVINQILEALYIDTRRQGLMLINYRKMGELDSASVINWLSVTEKQSIPVFVISDNDSHIKDRIRHLVLIGKLKQDMYEIWNGDFEQDNFGLSKVLAIVNNKLQEQGMVTLTADEVGIEMRKEKVLMRAIDSVCNSKFPRKLDDIISKKEIARILMAQRIKEIRKEFGEGGWKPILPIEKALHRATVDLERK